MLRITDTTDQLICSIVAVHGLNGHREETWTVNGVNWLRDLLPKDIPNARIFSWGYDANTHSTSPISAQYLYDHATTLISDLCLKRRMTNVLISISSFAKNFFFFWLKEKADSDSPHSLCSSQLGRNSCQKCRSFVLIMDWKKQTIFTKCRL